MSESATAREMAVFVAGLLGIPARTGLAVDRVLRDAGLRSSSGRGSSAIGATAQDVAHLLIALGAARVFEAGVAGAADTVGKFSSLPQDDSALVRPLADCNIPRLAGLPADHTFGEALVALIKAAANGEFSPRWRATCSLVSPWPSAELAVFTDTGGFGAGYRRQPSTDDYDGFKRLAATNAREFGTPDFRERREFSQETIRAIGALLNGGADV